MSANSQDVNSLEEEAKRTLDNLNAKNLLEHCELIVEAIKSYQEQGRVNEVAKYTKCLVNSVLRLVDIEEGLGQESHTQDATPR